MISTLPLIANRYALLNAEPNERAWPARARDIVFDRTVALKFLRAELGEDRQARAKLMDAVHTLHTLPHAGLVRYFAVEETDGDSVLIREWVPGISLLDLLRQRRALNTRECVQLLATLPATLDDLSRRGVALPPDLLGKMLLEREENAARPSLPGWLGSIADENGSPLHLRLNPLSFRSFRSVENGNVTVVRPYQSAAGGDTATRLFSSLLYDLLGGRRRDDLRATPLSALNEEANSRLRALGNGDYPDCAAFWRDFTSALDKTSVALPGQAKRAPSPQAWETPGASPPTEPAADVLRLIPGHAEAAPIHLVARSCFHLGRAYHEADFTTRLLPETPENYERTGQISRVHVRGEIIDGEATLRDGNGQNASGNGSWFNGHQLPADPGITLSHRGILNLANEYRLEVIPLFHDHVSDCRFNDFSGETAFVEQETGHAADGLHGGVAFIPLDGQKPFCDAIWLFSGIGFGLDLDGHVVWDYYGQGGSPGALLHHENRFWIKNTALPEGAVLIGAVPLQRGQIAPLVSGQELRLGTRVYHLQ